MQIFKDFSLEYLLCLQKSDEFHTVGEAGGSENQGHFRVNWEEFPSLDESMISRKKEGAWWGTVGRKG